MHQHDTEKKYRCRVGRVYYHYPDKTLWRRWAGPEGLLGLSTSILAIAVLTAVYYAHLDTERMLRAATTANRPWIKIAAMEPTSLLYNGLSGKAELTLRYQIENVGTAVATSVEMDAHLIALAPDESALAEIPIKQEAYCRAVIDHGTPAQEQNPHTGMQLFPGESYPATINSYESANYVTAVLEADAKQSPMGSGLNGKRLGDLPEGDDAFQPYLVGCVAYKTGQSPTWHQTGFILEPKRRTTMKSDDARTLDLQVGQNLFHPSLVLQQWYFGSGKID